MIAASVWIAFAIAKLFGELICRWRALTMPLVTVSSSPNGLPIATTPSPTATSLESPSDSGLSTELGASTFTTATSVEASVPTTVAWYVDPFQKRTEIDVAPPTTCSFVTTWPSASYTKPEPCAFCDWEPPNGVEPACVELTVSSTTLR